MPNAPRSMTSSDEKDRSERQHSWSLRREQEWAWTVARHEPSSPRNSVLDGPDTGHTRVGFGGSARQTSARVGGHEIDCPWTARLLEAKHASQSTARCHDEREWCCWKSSADSVKPLARDLRDEDERWIVQHTNFCFPPTRPYI